MAVRLLFDRILVQPLADDPNKPKTLIVTPDMLKEKPTRAKVLAVGPGAPLDVKASNPDGVADVLLTRLMIVKVGDVVVYGKYTGQEVEVAGQKCLIMREEDVIYIEVDDLP